MATRRSTEPRWPPSVGDRRRELVGVEAVVDPPVAGDRQAHGRREALDGIAADQTDPGAGHVGDGARRTGSSRRARTGATNTTFAIGAGP